MSAIRLGEWLAEPTRGIITGRGAETRLEPKVMAVLVHLATRPGQVFTKEELLDEVWPDTVVADAVLTRAVSLLRRAIDDGPGATCRIETIPRKGYRLVGPVERVAAREPGRPQTIAVLPFRLLSSERDNEYLADGFTELTISNLSRLGSLRVISRTSTGRYKGTTRSLPEIARELGADFVVEGSVMREGNDLQVVAQLIDPVTDVHVWSGEYRRAFHDVLSIEGDVARAIASEVEAEMTPEEARRLARRLPIDPRAHDAYLRGLYCWSRRSPEGFDAALRHFQEAIEIDASAAPAYAGMAMVFLMQAFYGFVPAPVGFARCAEAARKSIELDDELAEGYVARGGPFLFVERDFARAERDVRHAIALSPSLAVARLALADTLVVTGRSDEGLEQMRAGVRLSPLDPGLNMNLADHFVFARRFDDAILQYQRTVEVEPRFRRGLLRLARACALAERTDEAARTLEAALAVGGPVGPGADEAFVLARLGRTDEARALVRRLEDDPAVAGTQAYEVAQIHVALGDPDRAFAWIDRAFDEGRGWVVFLGIEPAFDPIRGDPRFLPLLRRARLSPTA